MKSVLLAAAVLTPTAFPANYLNPVIPGDYPDPSVIRVNKDYYGTATTSEWAPLFPILHSKDLVNWEIIGSVFQERPSWSVGNYWAPEIYQYKGKYYVYYTARKKGGPLSIAVASADRPEGPYTDHGPMISQPAGSIDAYPVEDETGKRFLIWKEDGNSRREPTIIWIQPLSEDGTRLEGEMKEILRNDVPWEGQVIEGSAVIRKDGYYYMFYAGNACCGNGCHYGAGVARAKHPLGPWEKHPNNPIIKGNEIWKCPGHGTLVDDGKGNWWFMYHAYHQTDSVFVGRQAVLDKVEWDKDGWPVINEGRGTASAARAPFNKSTTHDQYQFVDEFTGRELDANWQWPQHSRPGWELQPGKGGSLVLSPNAAFASDIAGGVLAIKTTSGDYTATTVLDPASLKGDTAAGLSAFGDMDNAVGVAVKNGEIHVWNKDRKKLNTLATKPLPSGDRVHLRMVAKFGHRYEFFISPDGKQWQEITEESLDGKQLPPWDRGIRVALTVGGSPNSSARFESLRIDSVPPRLVP